MSIPKPFRCLIWIVLRGLTIVFVSIPLFLIVGIPAKVMWWYWDHDFKIKRIL